MANYHDIRYNFAIPSGADVGDMILIKTVTASSSATVSFVDGTSDVVLDSTYRTYIIRYINAHGSANANLTIQFNAAGQSGFNETMTTTFFRALHNEDDTAASVGYVTGDDIAQGTGYQRLAQTGNDNDQQVSGEVWIFNPSSTTFVTHFFGRGVEAHGSDIAADCLVSGYINATAAVDEVSFKMDSGNIDSGTFKLYGIA